MPKKHKKKYLGIFPLFRGFKSTNILRAFILNSVAIAIIAVFTVEIKQGLDSADTNYNQHLKTFITFLSSLAIGLATYGLMWMLFGFGGGMLVNPV